MRFWSLSGTDLAANGWMGFPMKTDKRSVKFNDPHSVANDTVDGRNPKQPPAMYKTL